MNLALINPKVWLEIAVVAILAAAGWYGYNWVWDRGYKASEDSHLAAKLALAEATVTAMNETRATSDKLQADKDQLRSEKDAQISSINSTLASAIAGLRERPSRGGTTDVSGHTTAGPNPGITGAGLSREDSSFLVGEAARANKLRADLGECQAAYAKAREALR